VRCVSSIGSVGSVRGCARNALQPVAGLVSRAILEMKEVSSRSTISGELNPPQAAVVKRDGGTLAESRNLISSGMIGGWRASELRGSTGRGLRVNVDTIACFLTPPEILNAGGTNIDEPKI
jgi:hypothetical protein